MLAQWPLYPQKSAHFALRSRCPLWSIACGRVRLTNNDVVAFTGLSCRCAIEIVFHQIDEIGTADNEFGFRIGGDLTDSIDDVGRS
jgi:hypothetical protein